MSTDRVEAAVAEVEVAPRPHLDRLLTHACARHTRVEEARMIYGRAELLDAFERSYEAWLAGGDPVDVLGEDASALKQNAVRLLVQFSVDPE